MTTSPGSHDFTIFHPFRVVETQPVDTDTTETNESSFANRIRSVTSRIRNIPHFRAVNTEPVDTETNESSFASRICSVTSRICNIPYYAYRGTKAAVKYTYETINTYPRITSSISIVSLVAYLALTACSHKTSVNQLSTLAPLTLTAGPTAGLVTGLVLVALAVYDYKEHTNREESRPRITACKLAAAVITAVTSALSWAMIAARDYTEYTTRRADGTRREADGTILEPNHPIYSIMPLSILAVPTVAYLALTACSRRLYATRGSNHPVIARFTLTAGVVTFVASAFALAAAAEYIIVTMQQAYDPKQESFLEPRPGSSQQVEIYAD